MAKHLQFNDTFTEAQITGLAEIPERNIGDVYKASDTGNTFEVLGDLSVQSFSRGVTSEIIKGTGDASSSPFGVTTQDGKWELSFGNQPGWRPVLTNVSGVTKGLVVHYSIESGSTTWTREYQNNSMANGVVDTATVGSSWVNGATFGDVSIRATWHDSDSDFYKGIILRSSQLNGNNPIFIKVEKLNG